MLSFHNQWTTSYFTVVYLWVFFSYFFLNSHFFSFSQHHRKKNGCSPPLAQKSGLSYSNCSVFGAALFRAVVRRPAFLRIQFGGIGIINTATELFCRKKADCWKCRQAPHHHHLTHTHTPRTAEVCHNSADAQALRSGEPQCPVTQKAPLPWGRENHFAGPSVLTAGEARPTREVASPRAPRRPTPTCRPTCPSYLPFPQTAASGNLPPPAEGARCPGQDLVSARGRKRAAGRSVAVSRRLRRLPYIKV